MMIRLLFIKIISRIEDFITHEHNTNMFAERESTTKIDPLSVPNNIN